MLSALEPAGTAAHAIATLWWVMLVGALLIWVGVVACFVWVARSSDTPRHRDAGRWLFWGALVLPAVVLVPLVSYAFLVGEQVVRARAWSGEPVHVRAVARQWAWRFEYPQLRPHHRFDRLLLPAGSPIRLEVQADDVIHSFWVPRLAGKLDAIPGRTNVMLLDALEPGTHGGTCAEFCGLQHATMRFEVHVLPASEFEAAVRGEAADAAKAGL